MKNILLLIFFIGLFEFVKSQEKNNSSDNKTVTLTVTGQGKTIEEARNNALRSAIEQAFGAFISSNTTIINDSLIKDEIVSVTNGNIQKYNIVSETTLSDGTSVTTLKAIVSLTRLASFVQNKGFEVNFDGELFGMNIKLKKINDEAEKKAVINLCTVSFDFLKKSLEYSLKIKEPTFYQTDKYLVEFQVEEKTNSNYNQFADYFKNTLTGIGLTKTELDDYKSQKFPFFTIALPQDQPLQNEIKDLYDYYGPSNCLVINLRSFDSYTSLLNLFTKSNDVVYNFEIFNNNKLLIPKSYEWQSELRNDGFPQCYTMLNGITWNGKYAYRPRVNLNGLFFDVRKKNEFQSDNYFIGSVDELFLNFPYKENESDGLIIWLKEPRVRNLKRKQIFPLDEISKFNKFEIRPITK